MNTEYMSQSNSNIRSLFQKMDSNITQFKASMSSPNLDKDSHRKDHTNDQQSCTCIQEHRQRQLQKSFYSNQLEFIKKALLSIQDEQNDIYMKLLSFMSEYLSKIIDQMNKEIICHCKLNKINNYDCLSHKISFLREENHKFFKLIEQKNEECEFLKEKIHLFEGNSKNQSQSNKGTNTQVHLPFLTLLNQELSSRNISSNSSRISQFKHGWGDLSFPMCEGGHKKYFNIPEIDKGSKVDDCQILQQKNINIPNSNNNRKYKAQNSFKKPKIF